jgi:hypothetical protein
MIDGNNIILTILRWVMVAGLEIGGPIKPGDGLNITL